MPKEGIYKYPLEYNKKIPYYDGFIKRFSNSNYKQVRNRLIHFTLYMEEKRNKKILASDVEDCLEFFKIIDDQDILRVSKTKWRTVLNSYFKYVKEIKEKIEKKIFINPVPSLNLYDFKEKELSEESLEQEEDLITYLIIEKILNYVYLTRRRLFIITSLLLYTGARISEVCRIEFKKLDIEERYFITKIKSKKSLNRYGIYFLPRFFIHYLGEWINLIKIEHPDAEYLFPSRNTFISTNNIRKNLRKVKNKLGLDFQMNQNAL